MLAAWNSSLVGGTRFEAKPPRRCLGRCLPLLTGRVHHGAYSGLVSGWKSRSQGLYNVHVAFCFRNKLGLWMGCLMRRARGLDLSMILTEMVGLG